MPYIITPTIKKNSTGEWFEGPAYESKNIYSINEGELPPVNYDEHTLRPHSLAHIESAKHIQKDGSSITDELSKNQHKFYGKCAVLKFKNDNWQDLENGLSHKEISKEELEFKIREVCKGQTISKILISVEGIEENQFGHHDPKKILTLSLNAAKLLTEEYDIELFGTSWKSTDFCPGSAERPIHQEIFKKAIILEYVNLNQVPAGIYFINAFPIPLEGASEAPVCATLFQEFELSL